ncbi:MAG: hypothetical protein NZ608_07510, partial [candidate division WOR-3 bacterium]|nr:hypothetical protein [candidate division WOR-3 bacterium]
NDIWIRKRPLPQPITGAKGIAIGNYIYVFGGLDSLFHYLNAVLIYDIERDTWLFYSQMPSSLARPNIGFYDSLVHLIGGEFYGPCPSHYVLNLRNNSWLNFSPFPFPRLGFLTIFDNEKIYIIGGEGHFQGRRVYYRRFDVYNMTNDSWYLLDSINLARSYGAAGLLSYGSNNFLYVVGGKTYGGITGSLEMHQLLGIKEEKKKIIKKNENYQILGIYNLLGEKITKEDKKGIYFYLIKDKENYKIKKKIVIK